ncbi:STAS domain-containing protein [Actinospica durhamensis]|uniref:STAS domain-containing protein n=1 Tax=Actinospica durhamensis TaxID=1508375 RepID=A0A941IQF6_9ACTN|nr:STAS domain-containing protein [Actinospica durhamensis]MBR7832873.1 STAS domain-containing protein [Actinospica durhamensis]
MPKPAPTLAYQTAPLHSPPALALTVAAFADADVVSVSGDVDLASAEQLGAALTAARRPGRALVADLSGIAFFDSAAAHALLEAQRAAAAAGSGLLVVPSPAVDRVLGLTGLDVLFRLCADLTEAVTRGRAALRT